MAAQLLVTERADWLGEYPCSTAAIIVMGPADAKGGFRWRTVFSEQVWVRRPLAVAYRTTEASLGLDVRNTCDGTKAAGGVRKVLSYGRRFWVWRVAGFPRDAAVAAQSWLPRPMLAQLLSRATVDTIASVR